MPEVIPSKKAVRMMCRAHWGKDWHKVHPVIKKARLAWASGSSFQLSWGKVVVHEHDRSYVV